MEYCIDFGSCPVIPAGWVFICFLALADINFSAGISEIASGAELL